MITAFYYELGNCWRVEVVEARKGFLTEQYRLRVLEVVHQTPCFEQPQAGTEFTTKINRVNAVRLSLLMNINFRANCLRC
jgi:hypothetical protein